MAEQVKIRLRYQQIEALYNLYRVELLYEPTAEPHAQLLREHLVALYDRLYNLASKDHQERFTINLSPVEALAFWQYWGNINLTAQPYDDLLVRNIISQIDKKHQNLKRLRYGR